MNQDLTKFFPNGISVTIKREDLLHPFVSGNKFRKLKYNLLQAKAENKKGLLTFGGAYSNHIAAVAYAAKEKGFSSIGIIRGEELESKIADNPTLQFAKSCNMEFCFVSREEYRMKQEASYLKNLEKNHPNSYIIPEGGTNEFAIKGCQEILTPADSEFDYICCPVGTGGTIAGLSNSAQLHQKVLGFSALKGDFLKEEICTFAKNKNWELISDYHFGGYGKVNEELIAFINNFRKENNLALDPIYTGKMVYGVMDRIALNYFRPNTKILIIHTGGLQGIQGMNLKLEKKNLPKIEVYV